MGGRELRAVLGANLKLYRHSRRWSQADLAERAAISVTFLSDIERGNKWPYPDTLVNLAEALGIEVHELFVNKTRVADENLRETMNRFITDVSLTVNKSISQSVDKAMERLRTRYSLPHR